MWLATMALIAFLLPKSSLVETMGLVTAFVVAQQLTAIVELAQTLNGGPLFIPTWSSWS